MDSILETKKISIFIQESSWMFICTIPSFYNENSDSLVGAPNHPNWITFSRSSNNDNEHSHVILYINIFFMINVYSDGHQSTLKYFKNTEANIQNMLIMAGNFNIRDSDWNSSYPFYSIHTDSLLEIVDSFDLNLFCPI